MPSEGTISVSLGSQTGVPVGEAALHHFEHGRHRGGGARRGPSSPAMDPSAAASTVVPNSSTPSFLGSRRMTWTRWPAIVEFPVVAAARSGRTGAACRPGPPKDCSNSPIRYFSSGNLSEPDADHRGQIVRLDRQRQVGDLAGLEELRRPAGERPEQQPVLPVDHPGVQVRHRHRRGAQRRQSVHLGVMGPGQLRVVGAQPLPADREAAEALGLLDAGLLQQRQRTAAGADEHEFASQLALFAGAPVEDLDRPAAVGLLVAGRAPRGRTGWSSRVWRRSRAAGETANRSRRRCRPRSSSARPGRRSRALRPSAAAGGRTRPGSSMNSMRANSGLRTRVSRRRRR